MKILEMVQRSLPPVNQEITTQALSSWEYVVDDFLEIGCSLTEEKRRLLLEELRMQGLESDEINVLPSFSIGGRLVVIIEDSEEVEECWLYYPQQRKIERHLLKKKKS